MIESMVDVLVSGAVVADGHHLIPAPATVEAALQAAGGLARRRQMRPAGPIVVRRQLGYRKANEWRFSLNDPEPQAWRRFKLHSGDAVIFQWHLDGA
jgi:protein involved in polysaccharide export with SLBB domain